MTEQPPRKGLTRINTGYPALPYSEGWYFTLEEVRNIQRLSDHRNHANNGEMAVASVRTTRDCKTCGTTYTVNIYVGRTTCPACKTRQGGGAPRISAFSIRRKKGKSA